MYLTFCDKKVWRKGHADLSGDDGSGCYSRKKMIDETEIMRYLAIQSSRIPGWRSTFCHTQHSNLHSSAQAYGLGYEMYYRFYNIIDHARQKWRQTLTRSCSFYHLSPCNLYRSFRGNAMLERASIYTFKNVKD